MASHIVSYTGRGSQASHLGDEVPPILLKALRIAEQDLSEAEDELEATERQANRQRQKVATLRSVREALQVGNDLNREARG